MAYITKEEKDQKLSYWKHVSSNVSFDHKIFMKDKHLNTEESLSSNTHVLKPDKKIDCEVSSFTSKTSLCDACYKDQSFQRLHHHNLNGSHLKLLSVNLYRLKCNSEQCFCEQCKVLQTLPSFECKSVKVDTAYENQALVKKFNLKPLSVVLSDFRKNKTEIDSKCSYNTAKFLVHSTETSRKQNEGDLEKYKLNANSKYVFNNSLVKEDLFSSDERKLSQEELKLVAIKSHLKKATIQLHRIEETVAFCRSLDLQPVWKNNDLRNSYKKRKRLSKFKNKKS